MYYKLILSLFLVLISCSERQEEQVFWPFLKSQVYTSDSLSVIRSPGLIARPSGTKVHLLTFKETDKDYRCLFYRIPHGEKKGILFLEKSQDESCTSLEILKTLDGIIDLHYQFSFTPSGFKVITFQFKDNRGREQSFKVRLFNLRKNPSPFGGRVIFRQMPELIGSPLKLKAGERCQVLDKDCRVVKSNCDQCEGGHFPVMRADCPLQMEAQCGIDRCGEKEQAACAFSMRAITEDYQECSDNEFISLCTKGLTPICDENKNIICR